MLVDGGLFMNIKFIKILISSIFILTILCSCSNRNNDNKNSPTLSKEQIEADQAAQAEVGVVYPEANMGNYTRISAQPGWDVYVPANGGYRYSPTMLINSDGSIDMWTASNGDGRVDSWDWIRYRRSTDGGVTWTKDVVALKPTPNSLDNFSTCDPGVIKVGRYYYIGYTSTAMEAGTWNHVYVSRSLNPAGPYEKWNGQGWGGNPQPLIWFDGPAECWGAGEPSFVVKNGVLYIYYSWNSKDANGKAVAETRVATASALDENWPGKMELRGTAIVKADGSEDQADIKFVEETGKFIGITTEKRITKDSRVVIYQSDDGITFKRSGYVNTNTSAFLHNSGISSRPNGHISLNDQNFIAYAYGPDWGKWATRLNPIVFSESIDVVDPEIKAKSLSIEVPNVTKEKGDITNIFFSKQFLQIATTTKSFPLMIYGLYNDDTLYEIPYNKDIIYSDYDKKIIEINSKDGTLKALSAGTTNVTVKYKDYTDIFVVKAFVPQGPTRIEAKASSVESGWDIERLIDNDKTTTWSSSGIASKDHWVSIKFDKKQTVSGAILTPRVGGLGFPIDFNFQYSNDGSSWENIDGQVYNNYPNPINFIQNFSFSNSVEAQYIKINCTKTDVKSGGYFQLSEVEFLGADVPKISNLTVVIKSGIIDISKKTAVQIKAYKEMSNGVTTEVFMGSEGVIYSNYDQELVTVDKDGLVKAAPGHKLGNTTITVTLGDKSSNFEMKVTE